MSTCSSTEAMQALGYLRRSFTCFNLDAQAEKTLLRTFFKYTSGEVLHALETLKSRQEHYPSPASIEQIILAERPTRAKSYGKTMAELEADPKWVAEHGEVTPPDVVSDRVAELRERIGSEK